MLRIIVFSLGSVLALAVVTSAQDSRCADCHFANPQADPDPDHLLDWERSAHGRERVGCERCHGGDASTTESFIAHRGILASRNPSSDTHRVNLPRTCGRCHTGAFVGFQRSRHYELLSEGADDGPTCTTCHGAVAARLLSPRRLEQQCSACHGEGAVTPEPTYPVAGRVLLEEVSNVRALLRQARELIDRVDDEGRRSQFNDQYEQAEVPLVEAVSNAHAFVFAQMRERLSTSRLRAETLLNDLANVSR